MRIFKTNNFEESLSLILDREDVMVKTAAGRGGIFGQTLSGRILYLPVEECPIEYARNFLVDAESGVEGSGVEWEECIASLKTARAVWAGKALEDSYIFLIGGETSKYFASTLGREYSLQDLAWGWQTLLEPLRECFLELLGIPEGWLETSLQLGSDPLAFLKKKFPNFEWTPPASYPQYTVTGVQIMPVGGAGVLVTV